MRTFGYKPGDAVGLTQAAINSIVKETEPQQPMVPEGKASPERNQDTKGKGPDSPRAVDPIPIPSQPPSNLQPTLAIDETVLVFHQIETAAAPQARADAEHCSDCSVFVFGVRCSEHLNACSGIWYPVPGTRYLNTCSASLNTCSGYLNTCSCSVNTVRDQPCILFRPTRLL